jgi:hypothetical protein
MIEEVSFALQQCRINEQYPCKWTAIDCIDAVCAIPIRIFAQKPSFRIVCYMKILELRNHRLADEDVLEALERLRCVLQVALQSEEWVVDDDFDQEFRAGVQNPDLVFDGRDTETSLCEVIYDTFVASSDDDSDVEFRD